MPGSFVDAELELSRSDLLFRMRTVEGDDARLSGDARLQADLMALKYIFRDDLLEHLSGILAQQAGLARGKAAALLRILAHRFGEPSEPVRAAVLAADPDTLDAWIDRALDAARPEAVVRTQPRR